MRPKKTTLTHQQQLEILKSAYPNMQSAGSDHWVDTESASITFVGSLPEGNIREPDDQSFEQNNPVEIVARCCLNSITSKIIDELIGSSKNGHPVKLLFTKISVDSSNCGL